MLSSGIGLDCPRCPPSLGVPGLEGLPGFSPSVAVELARYLSLPTPPSARAHYDTNISSLPGEKRSLQVASPYAVIAPVVFGLQVNGSLFKHGKLHLLLMVATSEKETALQCTSLEDQ